MSLGGRSIYSPSLELRSSNNSCVEVDFVWLTMQRFGGRDPTKIVVGECKDAGPVTDYEMTALKSVAEAFPEPDFRSFVLFSQLAPFSKEQIATAKALFPSGKRKVILLSANDLQNHFFFVDETKPEKQPKFASDPEDLAVATYDIHFNPPPAQPSET
jgi:hypothetical protein